MGPPGFGPPGMPMDGPPFAGPNAAFAPPPIVGKRKEKVLVTRDESEATLIEEVTIGGVSILAGMLQRTYSGDRPSLCPT